MTDRRSADIGRGPSPDLEQLMHVLVQRAKLLLSLRGVVLAQKVRPPLSVVRERCGVLSGFTTRQLVLPYEFVSKPGMVYRPRDAT